MSSHEDIEERLRQLGRAVGTDDSFSKAVMARIRKRARRTRFLEP